MRNLYFIEEYVRKHKQENTALSLQEYYPRKIPEATFLCFREPIKISVVRVACGCALTVVVVCCSSYGPRRLPLRTRDSTGGADTHPLKRVKVKARATPTRLFVPCGVSRVRSAPVPALHYHLNRPSLSRRSRRWWARRRPCDLAISSVPTPPQPPRLARRSPASCARPACLLAPPCAASS